MNSNQIFELIDQLLDRNVDNYYIDIDLFTFRNEEYSKLATYEQAL